MAFPSIEEIEQMTPMMRQYFTMKREVEDAILFFRMGDFFEVFADDAELIAPILQIVLTSRERGDQNKVPFCGVPHHSAKAYWIKLLKMGFKISIADQVEDPAEAKGLVKREVIKTLTPGCIDELEGLDSQTPNYLISGLENPSDKSWFLNVADISTGEMRCGSVDNLNEFYHLLKSFKPKEVLIRKFFHEQIKKDLSSFLDIENISLSQLPETPLRDSNLQDEIIAKYFGHENSSLKTQGLKELISAVLFHFEKLKLNCSVFKKILPLTDPHTLTLSEIVIRDLELFETSRKREQKGSLFHQINKTLSPMGARLLRWSIARPLMNELQINMRHQAVQTISELGIETVEKLRENLKGFPDLERLCTRLMTGAITPIELAKIREGLKKSNWICEYLVSENIKFSQDSLIAPFIENISQCKEPLNYLTKTLVDEPGPLGEGNLVFREGIDLSLDQKNSLSRNGEQKVADYEQKIKEQTGINSIKVKEHKSFGLLIEITKTHLNKVPSDFIRRQTMVNCERFVTNELKELDEELSGASELAISRERELYYETLKTLGELSEKIFQVATGIAMIDMLQSFSWLALKDGYCRPVISKNFNIELIACRHPVVEKYMGKHRYVPNDVKLESGKKLMLITGPNMAGKSTVMRQTAIAAILNQAGCYIPAVKATLPIFDAIFSRVGASDDLSQGQSTFMVEMSEASFILRQATEKSLVILDEVGRGTSTEDGLAIASAILEHLAIKINCWTMFATHYHELVRFADHHQNIKNMTTEVIEKDKGIIFTHRLIEGSSENSFGIEVAKLAGIPSDVIKRAQEFLVNSENTPKIIVPPPITRTKEAEENNLRISEIIDRIDRVKINRTTPLQALNILNELQEVILEQRENSIFAKTKTSKSPLLFDA